MLQLILQVIALDPVGNENIRAECHDNTNKRKRIALTGEIECKCHPFPPQLSKGEKH